MTGVRRPGNLVLASRSPHRAFLLAQAGVAFRAEAAAIDERFLEAPLIKSGTNGCDIAEILAQAKAEDVATRNPEACVIGSDQTLCLDGVMLHKPANMDEARRRLLKLSGRAHELNSAVCLARDGEILWRHVETVIIRFRDLDPGFVGRHLAAAGDKVLSSVGAYQIEGLGVQLIELVEGDYFSIIGLPLLSLLAQLRKMQMIDL